MGRRRNHRLAARMTDLGFTLEGLAQEVNRVVAATAPERANASKRWVTQLVTGQTLWPREHYRAALEQIFRCSVLELGFVPPLGKSSVWSSPQSPRRMRDLEADMDRRGFLYLMGVAVIALPDVDTSARVGMTDLNRLREPLTKLTALDQQHGAANLAPAAIQAGALVNEVLNQATMSAPVRRAAYTLSGEYMTAAAWYAIDSDDLIAARRYLERATTVAAMARNPLLQARIWNVMAYRGRETKSWGEVLSIAQAAMTGTGARREPRVAALMHGAAAESYAAQGYRGWSERSIGRAHDAVDKASEPPAADWLGFVDHSEVDTFASNAARSTGRYRHADELAQRALVATPVGRDRNRVSRMLMSVQARLGATDIEAAVDAAEEPLARMPHLRSGRLLGRMHDVRREFATWSEVPAARDWVERYDAITVA